MQIPLLSVLFLCDFINKLIPLLFIFYFFIFDFIGSALSGGDIAGIVIAIVGALLILLGLILWRRSVIKKQKLQMNERAENSAL